MQNRLMEVVEKATLKTIDPQVRDRRHRRCPRADPRRRQGADPDLQRLRDRAVRGGPREMFVVRRIVQGEGVERKFPLQSPRIADIVVKRSGKVRRAKLYYLRQLSGKAVRLKERFTSTATRPKPRPPRPNGRKPGPPRKRRPKRRRDLSASRRALSPLERGGRGGRPGPLQDLRALRRVNREGIPYSVRRGSPDPAGVPDRRSPARPAGPGNATSSPSRACSHKRRPVGPALGRGRETRAQQSWSARGQNSKMRRRWTGDASS